MWKRILQITVIGAIFFFLGKEVVQQWDVISIYEWEVNYFYLTISFLVLCFLFFCNVSLWGVMAHTLAKNINWKRGVSIFATVYLVKYLPGKIGQPLGIAYLLNKEGISKAKSFLVAVFPLVITVVSAVIVSLVFLGVNVNFRGYRYLWIFIPVALALLHPRILGQLLSIFKRKVSPDYHYREIIPFIILSHIIQIIGGIAFFIFINSIHPIGIESLPGVIGSFVFAFLVGVVTFISPTGLGVREGVLVLLLKDQISMPVITVIAMAFRLLIIVSDVLCVGITKMAEKSV